MNLKRKIDPSYYDNTDFTADLIDAEKTGDLIVTKPGESARDAINRYLRSQTSHVATRTAPAPRRHVAAVAAV